MTRAIPLLLLLCAGCFPVVTFPELGRTPIELRNASTGKAVTEGLFVPVYSTVSGIANIEDMVVDWSQTYLAEPYIHRSGLPFQSSQPSRVFIMAYWIDRSPRTLALGATILRGVIVLAPGYRPFYSTDGDLVSGPWEDESRPDRIVIDLAPAEEPGDSSERIATLLKSRKIARRKDTPPEKLEAAGWPRELANHSLEIRFTRGERALVEAFFRQATARQRASTIAPSRPARAT